MGKLQTINVPGHAYFVTTTVVGYTKLFIKDKYCQIIIDNLKFYREKLGFKLYGFVVMPNHIHLLILPKFFESTDSYEVGFEEPTSTDLGKSPRVYVGSLEPTNSQLVHSSLEPTKFATISDIMRDFKKYTAIQIIKQLKIDKRQDILKIFSYYAQKYHPSKKRNYQVWMDRFWPINIYSEKYFNQKLDYIHNNPLRAGLVKNPDDYPWSSYQNYYLNNHSLIKIDY